jgi:hypothetical protein
MTALTYHQRRQLARIQYAHRRANTGSYRAMDRGAPLYRVYRRIRKGLIEALRAALMAHGLRSAGALSWAKLLASVTGKLSLGQREREALATLAAMPYRPEEVPLNASREDLLFYLAECRRYQEAAWVIYCLCVRAVAHELGLTDGRWLRHRQFGPMKLLIVNNFLGATASFGFLGETKNLSLPDCLLQQLFQWISDDEAAELEERFITPVAFPDPIIPETPPMDPARLAMLPLLLTEVAGLYYHQAKKVSEQLQEGMALRLSREPDNRFDVDAVAVLMPGGEKLGYVPRRCNAAISRRLAEGHALGIWLTEIHWADEDITEAPPSCRVIPEPGYFPGTPVRLAIEIRSPVPGDAPTAIEAAESARQQKLAAPEVPPSRPTPHQESMDNSHWPARFAFGSFDKARSALRHGDPIQVLGHVDSALKWAKEAWIWQHQEEPAMGNGWHSLVAQFDRLAAGTPLAMRLALLDYELLWHGRNPQREGRTALALGLLRLESLLKSHISVPEDSGGRSQGLSLVLKVPGLAASGVLSDPPLARRYPPLLRLKTLRVLRRLLRVCQRTSCGLPGSTSELKVLWALNRDALLVRATIRRLMASELSTLRGLVSPDENGNCWKPDAHYLALFPLLVPNGAKWHLMSRAAKLLEAEAWQEDEVRRLRLELELLQPETGRHGRRTPADRELYITEQLLLAAQTLDLRPAILSFVLLMPMKRYDRLRPDALWQLFDVLCSELFGKSRDDMFRTWPALLAEASDLDFALFAWQRALKNPWHPDQLAENPEVDAARELLEEALITHRGRWRADLKDRIPALECLCPWISEREMENAKEGE